MPVNNSDLNELLRKATRKPFPPKLLPKKPWYVRWGDAIADGFKISMAILIMFIVMYSLGVIMMENPLLFFMLIY